MWGGRRGWIAIAAQLGTGAACAVAWYETSSRTGIEGAYFSRAVGAPAVAVYTTGTPAWVIDALGGAALTLLAAAVATAVVLAWARRCSAVARASLALGILAIVAAGGTVLRALTIRGGGDIAHAIENAWVIDAARDTGPWLTQPDVLLGISAALALSAACLAIAAHQPRSQSSTS
jgi:hypothetical protein